MTQNICPKCAKPLVVQDRSSPPYMDAGDERVSRQPVLKCLNYKCPIRLEWGWGYRKELS